MKINIEEIDKDLYFDIILDMKEYLKLCDGKIITKELTKNKHTYNFGIQIDTEEEYV